MIKQLVTAAVLAASVIPAIANAGTLVLKNDAFVIMKVEDLKTGEKFDLLYGQEHSFNKDDNSEYKVRARALALSGSEWRTYNVPEGQWTVKGTATGGAFVATWSDAFHHPEVK